MRISVKMQKTIEKLAAKHGVDIAKPYAYMKLLHSFYMPLVVYNSGDHMVSVKHVNSAQMADPEIVFWTGSSAGWTAIEVTQLIGGRRMYAQPNEEGTAIVPISHRRQANLTDFAELWASNLIDQGWLEQSEQTPERFPMGSVVSTPGALAALREAGQDPRELLARHQAGDWGTLSDEDRLENDFSVQHGLRVLSAYTLSTGVTVWLISEADRSVSTFLLPSEY
jgi:hypothetical protein